MELSITLQKPEKAANLFGPADAHLRMLREAFNIQVYARGGHIKLSGSGDSVSRAAMVIDNLQKEIAKGRTLTREKVADAVGVVIVSANSQPGEGIDVYVAGQLIKGKTPGQEEYIKAVLENDLVFCLGPAGTGKTYLAVAMAVHMLKHQQARRLVLVRPAVEAGEKLGFLPGDMQAKVNPYLRPLFDALHDMMDYAQIQRFMSNDLIEVIPLAFMRGRTLNESVVILDEAQNTTPSQMLMFLTRMGNGTKMIVTGDGSQVDLEPDKPSGLIDAIDRLKNIKGLATVKLDKIDIVRHKLVQDIVGAYDKSNA